MSYSATQIVLYGRTGKRAIVLAKKLLQRHPNAENISVYKGNVIVTQGSIRMTGDQLTVNFTDDQELKDAYLEGRPAYFKQRPDNKDYDTEGEARQIEYHARESLLYLIEAAKLTQGPKLFSGHRITYDTERSILTARKARSTEIPGGGPTPPTGRVKLIIPPKKKN